MRADLTKQECRELLAGGGGVGRVAWCGGGGPQIYPVNFVLVGDDVVFRTSPYSDLGRQVAGAPVAFEVDGYDDHAQAGWSVVVRGTATVVDDPDEIMRLRRLGPQPWAPGQRNLFVRLRPHTVSGRRVGYM